MSIHSAILPLRTLDLRQVCYEGTLERCCSVVGRLRPDIVEVAEQPPSVTYINDDARRLARYHLLVNEKFPDVMLHQVVIFAPVDHSKSGRVPTWIRLNLTNKNGHGVTFSAPVRDLRNVPAEVFEKSGEMDDLLLGLLGPESDIPEYVENVRARVGRLTGEVRKATLEKLAAIWLMNDNLRNKGYREVFDMSWIDEVKDRPAIQQFIEIAGKERLEKERRLALAGVLINHARKAGLDLHAEPDQLIEQLAIYADETQLRQMIEDMPQMTDIREFVRGHNTELPNFTV